jgi:hypothetical protein
MNGFLIAAGAVSTFQFLGHVTAGAKLFLRPMLEAQFDLASKKTHHALFHYVSSLIFLSSGVLLYFGFNGLNVSSNGSSLLIAFTAAQNAVSGIVMITTAATSGIDKGVQKMFGWAFHFAIAALSFVGIWGAA